MEEINLDLFVEFFLACKMKDLQVIADKQNNAISVKEYISFNDYQYYSTVDLNLNEPYTRVFMNMFAYYVINNIEINFSFNSLFEFVKNAYEMFTGFDYINKDK